MNYSRNLIDKFYLVSNYILVFSFPFPKQVFNVAISIWLLSFILQKFSKLKFGWKDIVVTPIAISFVLLFIWTAIGLLFSQDVVEGKFVLEKYLFFIVVPIVLVDLKKMESVNFLKNIYLTFIVSCVLFLIYTLIKTTIESSILNLLMDDTEALSYKLERTKYVFSYQRFAQYGSTHAVYLTSYLIFAFFLCLELIGSLKNKRLNRWLKVSSVFFVFFIFTLQSAMLFFAFAVLILLYYIIENPKVKKIFSQVFFILLLAISGGVLLYKTDISPFSNKGLLILAMLALMGYFLPSILGVFRKLRIKAWMVIGLVVGLLGVIFIMVNSPKVEQFAKDHPSNVSARFWKWKSATDLIQESPWLGVGTGDTQNLLREKYVELEFESGLKYNYNEHNQYLRFWMENGIIALLIFLILLFLAVDESIKSKHFPMIVLVLLLIFFSYTESDLCRRSGVTFFVYFLVLFAYLPKKSIEISKS